MTTTDRYYVSRADGRRVSHYYEDLPFVLELSRWRARNGDKGCVVRRKSDRKTIAKANKIHVEKWVS